MGLLDRLHTPDDPDSPFSRALLMRGGRHDETDDTGKTEVPGDDTGAVAPEIDTGAAIRALLKEIHLQRDFGIVTPSHLFSLLHRHLHVTRGAILVPEEARDAYSPMATAGLDNTTRFRLRMPTATIKNFCPGPDAVVLEGADLEAAKPFLSVNELSRISRIALLPFTYNREILSILFVFDSPMLNMDLDVLNVLLAAFSERAGYMLFDGRRKPFAAARHVAILEETHVPGLISRLKEKAQQEKREPTILRINLTPLLQEIRGQHPHMHRDYLLRDLVETCALLSADHFSLAHTGDGEFLLAGLSDPNLDTELLVNLLGTTLQQLFGLSLAVALRFSPEDPDELLREC